MCDWTVIKKAVKKEEADFKLQRQINLVRELGEDADKYNIIDSREMSPELINEFKMAISRDNPNIQSVIPSSQKVRIRVGPSSKADYEIRYSYNLRSGVSGPKILPNGRTRDFCVHLIDANKLYTQAEISRMNNGFDLPVFEFAGGFWTQPDGSVSPRCRHTWYENLVIKK